jgi:hypothetical protein
VLLEMAFEHCGRCRDAVVALQSRLFSRCAWDCAKVAGDMYTCACEPVVE